MQITVQAPKGQTGRCPRHGSKSSCPECCRPDTLHERCKLPHWCGNQGMCLNCQHHQHPMGKYSGLPHKHEKLMTTNTACIARYFRIYLGRVGDTLRFVQPLTPLRLAAVPDKTYPNCSRLGLVLSHLCSATSRMFCNRFLNRNWNFR